MTNNLHNKPILSINYLNSTRKMSLAETPFCQLNISMGTMLWTNKNFNGNGIWWNWLANWSVGPVCVLSGGMGAEKEAAMHQFKTNPKKLQTDEIQIFAKLILVLNKRDPNIHHIIFALIWIWNRKGFSLPSTASPKFMSNSNKVNLLDVTLVCEDDW